MRGRKEKKGKDKWREYACMEDDYGYMIGFQGIGGMEWIYRRGDIREYKEV